MGQLPDLQEARRRLGLALDSICHDRWILGYLRGGWLVPIASSEVSRRLLRGRPLRPLARRALHERRPMVVNSVLEIPLLKNGYQWELDWPAILYTPVIDASRSPIGLLVLGCRRDHWYSDDEVGYAQSLGLTLAPMVAALRVPLSRLTPTEGEVAQLLSYGLSPIEVARAIQLDERRTHAIIDGVSRKLQSVNAEDLISVPVPARRRVFRAMTW